ncbi:transcriptional regulator [Shewanella sp. 10N.286.52.C2]|uniref:transcription/translation regulatory transformer protein RfaH n=1 Tax=unclassified Shewanella TaxID=196818 RepID=UPI000C84D026|nr:MULTISPECIES: transcription/translation regulatory transformer protein RfaH [unclassified Shewanella]MDO6639199.1 transcription/translation regulatory transformer protein RfaH [Shewanella sp. 5_MG-2023]PMG31183.1 transcriptional regulator [Shewanella sp. 10N.286.52.C2]
MKSWYLLYCKPRGEVRAQQNLALQQVESYLPIIQEEKTSNGKTKLVDVPLFPCYLFIYFDPLEVSVSRIHSTRGASRIIGCSETMTPIDERIIQAIKNRVSVHKPDVESDLIAGDKVQFTDGPFVDLEAIFEEKNAQKRCFVLFNIMGQQKRMCVDSSSIKKI